MKQTAVEWLMSQMLAASINKETEEMHITLPKDVFKQAKAMEKEQIINSHLDGQSLVNCKDIYAEQYYLDTFKSENIVMFMTPENGEIESIILTNNPDCGVKGITFKSE